jgi:O-methyltransferase
LSRAIRRLPRIEEVSRTRALLSAELRSMARELEYVPGAHFSDDLSDLKRLMRRAFQMLVYNGIEGDYAEFGCWGARTFTLASGAARLVGHKAHLWAFDSFEGLPDSGDPRDEHAGWTKGAMAMSEPSFVARCEANGVPRDSFTTVPGYYSHTLSDTARSLPERVCFAYVDCDLYTSTREALSFLSGRLCHGAVVAFDDYYCYGPTQPSGERLAASEFFGDHELWQLVPYIQYGWAGMSFVVEGRRADTSSTACW